MLCNDADCNQDTITVWSLTIFFHSIWWLPQHRGPPAGVLCSRLWKALTSNYIANGAGTRHPVLAMISTGVIRLTSRSSAFKSHCPRTTFCWLSRLLLVGRTCAYHLLCLCFVRPPPLSSVLTSWDIVSCRLVFHQPPFSEQYLFRIVYPDHVSFAIRHSSTYLSSSSSYLWKESMCCIHITPGLSPFPTCPANHLRPNWRSFVRIIVITGSNLVRTYTNTAYRLTYMHIRRRVYIKRITTADRFIP